MEYSAFNFEMGLSMTERAANLHRKLKARHLSMIAIGGSIGTGLFVASGNAIFSAGPGGALLAYSIIGVMVYFLMTSLGEMSTLMPTTGTFCEYSERFVDPAFGFAMSYNYWFNWAITVAAELSAAAFIMKFWFPHTFLMMWSGIFFVLILGLNVFSVRFYGESEYWLSSIKVIAVIVFIILGVLLIIGVRGGPALDFHNWTIGDAPFHGGWLAILGVFMVAGFSFQGTELIGVAAGEVKDPRKSIPKAIKQVFWRILLFYILAMAVISFIIPYTDPRLIHASTSNLAMSPFTIVFKEFGLPFAASIMNAIILVAVLSACNASLYSSTRTFWYMAKKGHAPQFFTKISSQGIPLRALFVTAIFGCLVFLSSLFGNGKIFIWLVNISSLSGFVAWLGIAISHYRFRKAYIAQDKSLRDLPYRAKLFPFGPLLAFVLCIIIIVGQEYGMFVSGHFKLLDFLSTYIGVIIFLLLWIGYKLIKKTKLVPLQDCDFEHHL